MAVWHIAEEEDFFLRKAMLPDKITHPHKRLQHLAGRYLLSELFADFPLELIKIADTRKPFLEDEAFHFSISHCGEYAAALVSKSYRVGVDIERIDEKTERLRQKYLSDDEHKLILLLQEKELKLDNKTCFTLVWSIKESMFKWFAEGGLDFREHLKIHDLRIENNIFTAHCSINKTAEIRLTVHGLLFNHNFLSWIVTSL